MSELKPGDRVRVEFEATVVQAKDAWRQIEIVADGKRETTWVQPGDCTLIEPEIVLPEVPGTIVLIDGSGQEFYCYRLSADGVWHADNGVLIVRAMLRALMKQYGYRVIPAAEMKGVSE